MYKSVLSKSKWMKETMHCPSISAVVYTFNFCPIVIYVIWNWWQDLSIHYFNPNCIKCCTLHSVQLSVPFAWELLHKTFAIHKHLNISAQWNIIVLVLRVVLSCNNHHGFLGFTPIVVNFTRLAGKIRLTWKCANVIEAYHSFSK